MTQTSDIRQQALSYMRHQSEKSLADLADLMERTAADCDSCLQGVSEQQASFHYDEEWSIKEVLGHMLGSGKGVNREIANLVENSLSGKVARMGVTSGVERPVSELRRELAALWAETSRLVASLPEDANPERTWDHPMFGPLNFRQWIAFQRMHALDHVQQMEKVKAHPGYPKAHSASSGQA